MLCPAELHQTGAAGAAPSWAENSSHAGQRPRHEQQEE